MEKVNDIHQVGLDLLILLGMDRPTCVNFQTRI